MIQNNIREILEANPVIPVVTFNDLNEVEPTIKMLVEREINCIEITLRTDVAYDAIAMAKKVAPSGFKVGMGTVINLSQVQKAQDLLVDFMVSPGVSRSLSSSLERSGIPFVPGVSTPSEVIKGINLGWNTLKFFPANLFGGVGAMKAYGQLFPDVKFCPTGGVNEETYQDYLALDNVIAVGGSWMTK